MEQQKKSYYNCSVDICSNSTLNCELSFFKLPAVSERRAEWLRLIHREDLIDSSCFRARVCEAHFSPDRIIINSTRKLLKRNSIPQLLLPLPNNLANKGIQAIIETADGNAQCDYELQTNAQVQTHLSNDTPRKRKLLSEVQRCRKGLKINNQSEANTFFKLCDKFLTPTFARVVKQQSKIKTQGHGNSVGRTNKKEDALKKSKRDLIIREKIKNDPDAYRKYREKEHQSYQTRKQEQIILRTSQLSPRQQEIVRRRDRELCPAYYRKIKTENQENTSPQEKEESLEEKARLKQPQVQPGASGNNSCTYIFFDPSSLDLMQHGVRPLSRCRFCAQFSTDCVDVTDQDNPYLVRNKYALTLNDLSVELDFNDSTLPKAVCRTCDKKLQAMFDFFEQVKNAQELLVNVRDDVKEVETLIVKTECESPTPDNNEADDSEDIDRKDGIVDSITVTESVLIKPGSQYRRESVEDTPDIQKKFKLTKDVEREESELVMDIKEETVEVFDAYEAENSKFNDLETINEPSEVELAVRALINETSELETLT